MSMIQNKIAKTVLIAITGVMSGCANLGQVADSGAQLSQAMGYNPSQLSSAVKQALELSAVRATDALSQNGGYSNNPKFKIAMPEDVQAIANSLRSFGLGGYIDNVEQLLNRGAEKAAAEAKPFLIDAIKNMDVNDAVGIIRGGDSAATAFFKAQTEQGVRTRYQGLLEDQLTQLGFYGDYKQLLNAYKLVPIANKPNLDLESRAIDLGLDALYSQIADEEKKIRANPVDQGSALIGAVFGQ
ncbi:MAG TPA: DUF4197 domain-containing protein [Marinagarivorans sp.]